VDEYVGGVLRKLPKISHYIIKLATDFTLYESNTLAINFRHTNRRTA